MPLYEYTCLTCDKKFDMLRAYKDADSPIACVSCQSIDTKRSLSTFFSHSAGGSPSVSSTVSTGGCGGCSGGSCGSCHH
jgi:putative FmdB family regulatory protein